MLLRAAPLDRLLPLPAARCVRRAGEDAAACLAAPAASAAALLLEPASSAVAGDTPVIAD